MSSLNDPGLVAREYATLERVALRRLDRTAWCDRRASESARL
jgi:hypothetical protein